MRNRNPLISQRRQYAYPEGSPGYANGGLVKIGTEHRKATGLRNSPLESIKRANGIPGMKKGGKVC